MGCAGRFKAVEGLGFPAVTNYDYDVNLSIRGSDDRTFRWEDVCIDAAWHFQEVTRSGDFEGHAYTGLSRSTPFAPGVLTTGDQTDALSFLTWEVSGHSTFQIPISGFVFNSGDHPGINETFTAFNIGGTGAIGFYANSDSTGDIPAIHSTVGLVSGSGIPVSEKYQFYLEAYQFYGFTGGLRTNIIGYDSDAAVAYYDPRSGVWDSNPLTTGHHFVLDSGKYSEVRFDFYTSGFPGVNPTGYRITVETESTGCFIVIDDIHIDQYLSKNPFTDYALPTGYMLQITPDLGWHDTEAMFEEKGDTRNPHLNTFGPYVITGELTDELDGSVSVDVDAGTFLSGTYESYKNYLWRAIAVSPNGGLGAGGYPARFEYVGRILDGQFTVDNVFDDPLSVVKVITGTKTSRMVVLVDEVEHPNMEYPTANSWKLTVNMDRESLRLSIRGKDKGGVKSSIHHVQLNSATHSQVSRSVWNVFDEHGLLMHLPRLPNEDNTAYRDRIKDVNRTPGGHTFEGVVGGGTRELGLSRVADGLQLQIPTNSYGRKIHSTVEVEVAAASIRVRVEAMIKTETLLVDPVYQTVDLSDYPKELPVSIEDVAGHRAERDKVEISKESEEEPTKYQLKINDSTLAGKFVRVTYEYYKEFLYKDYPTLHDLVTGINAFRDFADNQLLSVRMSSKLSGNESSMGLYTSNFIVGSGVFNLSWSPMFLKRVSDRNYREFYKSEDGTYWNTKFYEYVKQLKANSNVFWGHVEADRDFWDGADSADEGMDDIPTLMDPPLAHYSTAKSGEQSQKVDSVVSIGRIFRGRDNEIMVNKGLSHTDFTPGVGYTQDLRPGIHSDFSLAAEAEETSSIVSKHRNTSNKVLFSGQK